MRGNDIIKDKKGYRNGYKDFYMKIFDTATYLSSILENLPTFNQNLLGQTRVHKIYTEYMQLFIEEYPTLNEQYSITGGKRGMPAMHIFTELSRARFALKYHELTAAKKKYIETNEEPDLDHGLFLMSMSRCETDFWSNSIVDSINPEDLILGYNQEQVIDLLLVLSQRVDEMPYDQQVYKDFDRLSQALFTRNCIFFCEACTEQSLNLKDFRVKVRGDDSLFVPNRDYIMLTTIYFNTIFRRHYYYSILRDNIKAIDDCIDTSALQDWVKMDVCNSLGDEGFEDTYGQAVEECFTFTGDKAWFKYRYPERPATKGPILDCIRPNMAKKYFTQYRVTKDPVLSAAEGHRDDMQGKSSRYFVLLAVDQFFRNNFSAHWLNAVLITNSSIEVNQEKICKSVCPCLLQVLGGYWVYSNGYIYPSNNIYETIWIWFYILKKEYNNVLFRVDLTEISNKILVDNTIVDQEHNGQLTVDRL